MSDQSNPTNPSVTQSATPAVTPPSVQNEPKVAQAVEEPDYTQSRWERDNADDNSLAPDDEAFIGVSPEYANYANVGEQPFLSEDKEQRELELQGSELAEELKVPVQVSNPASPYEPLLVHPSEKTKPQDAFINQNRKILERAAEGE